MDAGLITRLSCGLSPRLRGNPGHPVHLGVPERSIPALAGEPPLADVTGDITSVYPRACGGTCCPLACHSHGVGLSPRLRGNLEGLPPDVIGSRSIPALAGEPRQLRPGFRTEPVYPRACGGTVDYRPTTGPASGLSPRLRGNRRDLVVGIFRNRSIPALAGEPPPGVITCPSSSVYPRACGGTALAPASISSTHGLSPRLRGNPGNEVGPVVGLRSIPALAGEPHTGINPRGLGTVYPRACGGTLATKSARSSACGLSPRLRGNHTLE